MTLSPEQKKIVAGWVIAGDGLSTVQKKLTSEFKISLTFRDVRFLVDDLDLQLKDPAPKMDASDLRQGAPAAAPDQNGAPADSALPGDAGDDDAFAPGAGGAVTVTVDKLSLIPGALASGAVTFSDGVTGKWIVDNQGRPGFSEISRPGYRPSPADAQAFMQELSLALQKRGY